MKFIVSSSTLLKQVQLIGGALNNNTTLPILDNFLFTITDGSLTIRASDLETTMETSIDIEAKENGQVAIPAKLLIDTLKSFPDQPLTFTINPENYGIEISSDYGKYKLTGHDATPFPKTPEIEDASLLQIDAGVLFNAISKTIFATGNDELRPVMSGVYFELNNDNVTFVATDAHKLVKYGRSDIGTDNGASFILPKKPLNLLKSILSNVDDEVQINFNETNADFTFGKVQLTCRLIDGKYPNYNAVIPTENPNKMTINRNALLNSVKRVAVFSNKTTHQVKLKIAGSELSISAEDLDFSNEANERLTCEYDGNDMEIGFNSRFLIEMLNNIEGDEVSLEMSQPNRAGILTPIEKSDESEDVLMLVMPVMLNN